MTVQQKYRTVVEIAAGVALLVLGGVMIEPRARAQTPPPIAPRPVQDPAQQLIDQQRELARQRQLA